MCFSTVLIFVWTLFSWALLLQLAVILSLANWVSRCLSKTERGNVCCPLFSSPAPSPDPNHLFLHPFALSLRLPISHSRGSAFVLVIALEGTRGLVSVRICLTTRRRWWKMRQVVAIYQHLSGAWRRSGRGRRGGAKRDTEGFFPVWGRAWWNGCGFYSAASDRGWIKRGEGRGKGLSSICRLPLPHQASAFSPSATPSHIISITPLLLLLSQGVSLCSANVQRALFPLCLFSFSYAICISVGVETDDRMPIEAENEQGEKLFQSMSTLPPTL